MRRGSWVLVVALGLIIGLIGPADQAISSAASGPAAASAAAPKTAPNVLLILTDDQRAGSEVGMPTVMAEIAAKGTSYPNAFVPTSSCCPSRVSLLTGKFAHNSGVWDNTVNSAWGAWSAFNSGGEEYDTLATRLHNAGYRTGLFGKYVNGVERASRDYTPPGWDNWVAFLTGHHTRYQLSTDPFPIVTERRYLTDELAEQAVNFIRSAPTDQPVFTYFAPFAPHYPFNPGPYAGKTREAGLLDRVKAATRFPSPATNQADMSSYPQWMRELEPSNFWNGSSMTLEQMVERHSDMLMSVDAAIAGLLDALRESGRLDNTLIIFASDNGFMWGEHRLQRKNTPYDVSVRVPLLMRHDGLIPSGTQDPRVVAANVDVHATILDAVGVTSNTIDGTSVRASAREGVVMESSNWNYRTGSGQRVVRPAYCGFRTRDHLFVRYTTGEEELYDYAKDPHELTNVAARPDYAAIKASLEGQARRACSPTPPGFAWGDDTTPLQPPTNVQARRLNRSSAVITWRAPSSVGTQLPEYHVYAGSVFAPPICIRPSLGLGQGLRCRVKVPAQRQKVPIFVVSVRGSEIALADPLILRRQPPPE